MDEYATQLAMNVQELINTWMKNNPGKWPDLTIEKDTTVTKPETSITASVTVCVDDL